MLNSIPSVDRCEVRRILYAALDELKEGEGFPTDRFVIGNGESCLDSPIDRSIGQISQIERYFLLLRSAAIFMNLSAWYL